MAGKGVCPREGVCDGVTPVEICPGDLSMGLPEVCHKDLSRREFFFQVALIQRAFVACIYPGQ